jgi:antitoxin VapB
MQTAKIFKNGSSQAVRLPKGFRFKGREVSVYHLGQSVVLQPINETWKDVYDALEGLSDEDFEMMRNMEDPPPQDREAI